MKKENLGCGTWIAFWGIFIFVKHVLLNPKYLSSMFYMIGVMGLIAVSIFFVYVLFRPLIKR